MNDKEYDMTKRVLVALFGLSTMMGCSPSASSPGGVDPVSDGGTPIPEAGVDGPPPDGVDAGTTVPPAKNLTLRAVSFRSTGRRGDSLRIAAQGADSQKATASIFVRFVDETGAPVVTVDTNWDGIPDSAEKRFRFEEATLGKADFIGTVTIPHAYGSLSRIAKAIITLEDAVGGRSAPMTALLTKQAVRVVNDPCDVGTIQDRCTAGLSCGGTPAVCRPGTAPSLDRVGYFGGVSPRILVRGSDADEDVASLAIEYLDASGNPGTFDISNDPESPDMSSGFEFDATGSAGPAFELSSEQASGIGSKVPKIAVTATDEAGHVGTRTISSVAPLPVRGLGQTCDSEGFDACGTGNACSPGIPSATNTCQPVASLRTAKSTSAPLLDPSKNVVTAFGNVAGASLWDPPIGCVGNDTTGRPESAVKLHLAKAASKLTITTALPETTFDTAVYLLPTSASEGAVALGCNDDDTGYASSLVLSNVAAGDYVIVVESVQMRGGRFGIKVEAK